MKDAEVAAGNKWLDEWRPSREPSDSGTDLPAEMFGSLGLPLKTEKSIDRPNQVE